MTRREVANKVIAAPETAYRLDGPVDAPVLLLSNGLAADLSMWDAQIPFLAAHYRTLRYDNRGHGDTPASPGPYSIDLLASDALDLLDQLAIRKAHFLGMSLGGTIGWMLAASYPERIASLVLCDTPIEAAPEVWATRITTALSRGMEPLVEPTLERWLTASFRAASPAVTERVGRMIRRTSPVGYAGCAAAIQSMQLTSPSCLTSRRRPSWSSARRTRRHRRQWRSAWRRPYRARSSWSSRPRPICRTSSSPKLSTRLLAIFSGGMRACVRRASRAREVNARRP